LAQAYPGPQPECKVDSISSNSKELHTFTAEVEYHIQGTFSSGQVTVADEGIQWNPSKVDTIGIGV